jgi:hypothetical protein
MTTPSFNETQAQAMTLGFIAMLTEEERAKYIAADEKIRDTLNELAEGTGGPRVPTLLVTSLALEVTAMVRKIQAEQAAAA